MVREDDRRAGGNAREGHGEETSPCAGEGMGDVVALLGAVGCGEGDSGGFDGLGHDLDLMKHQRV